MVVVYKEKKTAFMLNVAIPADISKKERKKMDKKKVKVPGVKEQIKEMLKVKSKMVPGVKRALRTAWGFQLKHQRSLFKRGHRYDTEPSNSEVVGRGPELYQHSPGVIIISQIPYLTHRLSDVKPLQHVALWWKHMEMTGQIIVMERLHLLWCR